MKLGTLDTAKPVHVGQQFVFESRGLPWDRMPEREKGTIETIRGRTVAEYKVLSHVSTTLYRHTITAEITKVFK